MAPLVALSQRKSGIAGCPAVSAALCGADKELRESCAASSRFTPHTELCKALASAAQQMHSLAEWGTKMGARDAAPAD